VLLVAKDFPGLVRKGLKPASFAVVFFFVPPQPGRHDTCPSQVTHEVLRIVASHDRQAADVMMDHPGNGVMKDFIRERDNQMLAAGFEDGSTVRRFIKGADEITARDDSSQLTVFIDDERALTMR
jgi:hypothetical protein